MSTMEADVLSEQLEDVKGKLVRTITQMKLIDIKLRDLNQRYKRASTNKKNSFRYHLRMRMSITAGVKLMYMQYLTMKAEDVRSMEQTLATMRNQQQAAAVAAQDPAPQVEEPESPDSAQL